MDLAAAAPAIDPADRLSKLPDEILAQILSFLPAQEAVRTCVLARAWRGVWKLTRRQLISGNSVEEARKFVDLLLRRRLDWPGCVPLDACEIVFIPAEDDAGDVIPLNDDDSVNRWIRRALRCHVKALRVDMGDQMDLRSYLHMSRRLVSPHLARLELRGVSTCRRHVDFSGCHALERLEFSYCDFSGMRKMTSPSLKHLVITCCESVNDHPYRFQICVPRLVSLRLEDNGDCRTPLLESMPELAGAYVEIGSWKDACSCDDRMGCCYHVTRSSHISDTDSEEGSADSAERITTKCMLLEGLAHAKDLVLIARSSRTYIIKRDLRWCPTFSKLKTLVLNDNSCEPDDCSALACILEHAPFLEKLTVIFSQQVKGKYNVEVEGCLDATTKSAMISQHLKIVKVKCEMANERFRNILNFFGTLNIFSGN